MLDCSHYDTLDIPPTADLEAIKRAYRRQIRAHHPDQYVARRDTLKREGDVHALRQIEKTIKDAEQRTQTINAAYRVLSDAEAREKYDRDQFLKRQREQNFGATSSRTTSRTSSTASQSARPSPDNRARRTNAQRPNAQRPNAQRPNTSRPQAPTEQAPWAWLSGLLVVLVILFSVLSNFLSSVETSTRIFPTAIGFTADELQATTSARQATYVARTQTALEPTRTPVGQDDLIASANAFYRAGSFIYAIEGYNEALERIPDDPELYYVRGLAYLAMAVNANDEAARNAVADFSRAIALDNAFVDAYRERGLVYYARWLVSGAVADADQAQDDLLRYTNAAPPDNIVRDALEALAN